MRLLERAPNLINIPNNQDITPFAIACQQPQINILNKMLKHQDAIVLKTIYQAIDGKLTKPVLDKLDKHLGAVKATLMATRINTNIQINTITKMNEKTLQRQDTDGNTALHYAVTHNQHDVIMRLLEKAPDLINPQQPRHHTLCHSLSMLSSQKFLGHPYLDQRSQIVFSCIYQDHAWLSGD